MSRASEMKAMGLALSQYPLMTVGELAAFLQCSDDHARGLLEDGTIPSCDIGRGSRHEYRVDPIDVAVHLLAGREGITAGEFWERHGPQGTPEACQRLLARIRRAPAA